MSKPQKKDVKKRCLRCGKEFYVTERRATSAYERLRKKFCSYRCKYIYHNELYRKKVKEALKYYETKTRI